MDNVITRIELDVYDHDTTPTTIKTIALDNKSRYIYATLLNSGEIYQPYMGDTVELVALRPDHVGATVLGEVVSVDTDLSDDTDILGVGAEITQAMLAVTGNVLFQFKITRGQHILRTEIFTANNGRALDSETEDWVDYYQGYNLDELVEKIDFIGTIVEQAVSGGITLDEAILETHNYIDRKINERITIIDNAIHINV